MKPPEGLTIETRRVESHVELHPRLLARVKAQREYLERTLTPEALARLDAAEREADRRALEG
jgi:hypothetical protein